MFSKRTDGRQIKGLDPIFRMIPYIMKTRAESQVMVKQDFRCEVFDGYIKSKRAEGHDLSYMSILIAAYVRLLTQRPQLNRFVVNGRIYARYGYEVVFVVKKSLTDDSDEMLLKLHFDGTENIFEINDMITNEVKLIRNGQADNLTDKLAKLFMKQPNPLIKGDVRFVMKLDDWNMMPRSVIEASPFHCSMFLTNVKSIKLNYIYHHLYNFGTASVFLSLGKSNDRVSLNRQSEPESEKVFTLGCVLDERICDGLYLSRSLMLLEKYMNDPSLLEENLTEEQIVRDID
ncbi:MAG: 2-oxoglutarate dehydrogenase [Eubacteriaceae bacterium]|nr:2-oxoglutarate dehydrogenase [Eubacteriaceae bacterium]